MAVRTRATGARRGRFYVTAPRTASFATVLAHSCIHSEYGEFLCQTHHHIWADTRQCREIRRHIRSRGDAPPGCPAHAVIEYNRVM